MFKKVKLVFSVIFHFVKFLRELNNCKKINKRKKRAAKRAAQTSSINQNGAGNTSF